MLVNVSNTYITQSTISFFCSSFAEISFTLLTEERQLYFYSRLGELIKFSRIQAGVTQEDLASYLGLSRVSVVNIEKGKQKVQIHTLIEIVSYLNASTEDFFEKIKHAAKLDVSPKLEKTIKRKVDSTKTDEINIVTEFVNFSLSVIKK